MLQVMTRNWWMVLLRGMLAVLFGILALILPGAVLRSLIIVFGIFILFDGILALVAAFRAAGWRPMARLPRWPACRDVPALSAECFSTSIRKRMSRGTASSMPTAPNSFTTIAAPCIAGCSRSAAMSVVLPLPRKPVTIEIGMRSLIDSAWTERENEPAATRIPAFPRRA